MKNKVIKLLLLAGIFVISSRNIYGASLINKTTEENKINIKYEVDLNEKDEFLNSIESEYYIDNEKYNLNDYEVKNQNYIDEISIKDTKEVISNSDSLTEILKLLPSSLDYDKDGYTGKNELKYDEIQVESIYNGYHEEYVDETKQYFDLERNDMDFIPKEIEKDGLKLYLINVEWYTQTTKFTGDNEIPNLYRGEAFYRGVKKINYPYTYRVIANYEGKASKEIEKPCLISVVYEKEIVKNNIIIPTVVTGTSGLFIILFIFYFKNKAKIYGNRKLIGICGIKNDSINLNKIKKCESYILKLNNGVYKKYKGKTIKLIKNDITKYVQIVDKEMEFKI